VGNKEQVEFTWEAIINTFHCGEHWRKSKEKVKFTGETLMNTFHKWSSPEKHIWLWETQNKRSPHEKHIEHISLWETQSVEFTWDTEQLISLWETQDKWSPHEKHGWTHFTVGNTEVEFIWETHFTGKHRTSGVYMRNTDVHISLWLTQKKWSSHEIHCRNTFHCDGHISLSEHISLWLTHFIVGNTVEFTWVTHFTVGNTEEVKFT